jgi:hypothetical protein
MSTSLYRIPNEVFKIGAFELQAVKRVSNTATQPGSLELLTRSRTIITRCPNSHCIPIRSTARDGTAYFKQMFMTALLNVEAPK